jgi:hypothetical protein
MSIRRALVKVNFAFGLFCFLLMLRFGDWKNYKKYYPKGLWVRDVKTLAGLWELKRDLEFLSAGEPEGNIPPETLLLYKNRFQQICNEDLKIWSNLKENQIESNGKQHEI